MTEIDQDHIQEAADWHARVDASDMDWDAFAHWLDTDAGHQIAYDHVARTADAFTTWAKAHGVHAEVETALSEVTLLRPAHVRRWWFGGGAVAAAFVAAVSVPALLQRSPATVMYETGRTEQRDVALGGGSSVRLDRGTRIMVASGAVPRIRIERGAAYFNVRHDPARTLVVQSGAYVIRDVGTRFDVTRRGDGLSVAVEEGAVDVAWRDGAPVRVSAGRTFEAEGGKAAMTLERSDPGAVASWRSGRLVYDNAPLALVAADASRYTSTPISVDPAVADLKLSGVLLIGDGSHLVDQVQALLPVQIRREDGRIELVRNPRRP